MNKNNNTMNAYETIKRANKRTIYKWLQGEKMEGYKIKYQPKLKKEQAFAIIYLLQEAYGFIPDVYEKCDTLIMKVVIMSMIY